MRIKMIASDRIVNPESGPYVTRDIVARDKPYVVGEMTHCGQVIKIPPPGVLVGNDAEQCVIVKLDPASLATRPDESRSTQRHPPSTTKLNYFQFLLTQ
jgi:hypothetical protein